MVTAEKRPEKRAAQIPKRHEPRTRAASAPGKRGGAAGGPDGVACHRTEQHRGKVATPGPHPSHPSSPVDPGGAGWGKISAFGLSDRAAGQWAQYAQWAPNGHNWHNGDQLRDQRGQEAKFWPPFTPWVHRGAEMGWMWSRGGNFASVLLGSVAGDPVWPPGRSSSLSRQLRPRVFSAHRP